ncbi:MAG: 3-phosphoshikimate 1-carboxyvinyltransferase, partial [Bacteroidia bacterium]|nr:3-phosphoshikimate 1-carboxyvinyltransferase [Bacteroidia bacterium]
AHIEKKQSIQIDGNKLNKRIQTVETYNDHRMAMSFAPLALQTDAVIIQNQDVVKKSYPNFWNDLLKLGFTIEEVNA